MVTAIEFVHNVRMGNIDVAMGYMDQLSAEMAQTDKRIYDSAEYVYALRVAISRNDYEMCDMLTAILHDEHIFDKDTILSAAYKDIKVFMAIVGHTGHGLYSKEFSGVEHPLISAAKVCNTPVAKYIIEWIRTADQTKISGLTRLKTETIKAAATSNCVVICNLLIKDESNAKLAYKTLIECGHVDSARRFANSKYLDFSKNSFELVKLAAPFPSLLKFVLRHPSLVPYHDKMPTEYSQLAMNDAMNDFHETSDMISKSFEVTVRKHAVSKIMATGCSTRDAVTKAHSELKHHYDNKREFVLKN